MKEGSIVAYHPNNLNTLIYKLLLIGVKVEDEDKAIILLSSMLDTFDHMVVTITNSSLGSLKFDDAVAKEDPHI